MHEPDIASSTKQDPILRESVPIEDFEKITQKIPKEIQAAKDIFDAPEDRPIVAQLIGDIILDRDTPNEAKLILFKEAFNLIKPITYDSHQNPQEQQRSIKSQFEANIATAIALINILRAEPKNELRIRMAAIISHALQPKYALKGISYDGDTPLTFEHQQQEHLFESRLQAFQDLAFHQDQRPIESVWARSLLYPTKRLQIFNAIYDLDTNLITTPKILEEITEITEKIEYDSTKTSAETNENVFTGLIVNLPLSYFPTPEKLVEYQERTGRSLPLRIVRKLGGVFISIDFPSDLTENALKIVQQFREGKIDRQQVMNHLQPILTEFLNRINPDQRRELENSSTNLELRFTTTRDAVITQEEKDRSIVEENIPTDLQTYYSADRFAAD